MTNIDIVFISNRLIVVGAVRYYMGRHTAGVHQAARFIGEHAHLLDVGTVYVLKRDISEWLDDNPTCEFAGVDDREPWKKLLEKLNEVGND